MLSKDLYFVIIHFGAQELTKKAVESLLDASVISDRIIVVENGEKSGVALANATIIPLSQNGGYAHGVNVGIRYALGYGARNVVVMNNDLTYVAGTAESMLAEVEKGFGCVGARVSEGGEKPTLAGGFVDWFRGRTHFVFNETDLKKLHYVSGAFFLITRECFESVGEMPEVYFHTWEDTAWGFRMRAKGWRLGFARTPVIPHLASQALSESKLKTYYLVRNGSLFVREYAPFWAKAWLVVLEPIRLLWARIRGREEIIKALRDARNNIGGKLNDEAIQRGERSYLYPVPCTLFPVPLSVIIVTHQSQDDIGACLQSIKQESVGLNVEIIVVDAGSTDNTKAVVQNVCSEAKYFQLRNVGFAAAANLGAVLASGDILFFLNPDAILLENSVNELKKQFNQQPQIGIVGGLLVDQSGNPEKWQMMPFPSLKNVLLKHLGRSKSSVLSCPLYPVSCTLSWVSGGALGISKTLFQKVGGFNEQYFLYFEDVDLCRRVRNKGLEVVLNPRMRVLHKGGKSTDQQSRVRAYDRSQNVYFSLHRSRMEYWAVRLMRVCFRRKIEILFGVILSVLGVFGAISGLWLPVLATAGALVAFTATLRFPKIGIGLLLGSLLVGQTVRIELGQFSGTATDYLLPVVLLGLFYAVLLRGRLKELFSLFLRGWWFPVAFLPGILLAWQRLPATDFLVALSYSARFFAVLSLIPLLRTLRVSFTFVRNALLTVAILLAGLGFFQLVVLPVLPPTNTTSLSQLFLGLSGGGWDPHQYRLFATWLDPNFLGLFFVMALGLIFTMADRGADQTCSAPRSVKRLELLWYWLAGIIIFIALTLTRSRASFLALFVMLFGYFLFSKAKRLFIPLLTLIILALFFSPVLTSRLFVAPLTDPTVQLRMQSWQQAISHFQDYPLFGMGYNAYGIEQIAVGNIGNTNINSLAGSDNFPILLLATTGLWGVVILLTGISLFLARQINRARAGSEMALSVLLIFVALFIHSLFIQSFTYIHLFMPLALMIGTVFRESPKKETP